MDSFSEVEETTEGAAPVDQSPQERLKESPNDFTFTLPYSHDISKSSPCSYPVVLISNSPSVATSPDIPIKVVCLSDPISVPSFLFYLQGYSSSTSTPSLSSISILHAPNVADNLISSNLSCQDVPHSVPLFRPIPIIGSFSMSSQTLADPCPSSSLSFDMLPPLSSSITHNQNLPSCSFITPKIIPPFVSTSLTPCGSLFPRKSRGTHSIRGKFSWKHSSRGKPPRGRGGAPGPSLDTPLTLIQVPTIFSFPILYLCFPRDTCLEMEHWIYLPDLGSAVTHLRILQSTLLH